MLRTAKVKQVECCRGSAQWTGGSANKERENGCGCRSLRLYYIVCPQAFFIVLFLMLESKSINHQQNTQQQYCKHIGFGSVQDLTYLNCYCLFVHKKLLLVWATMIFMGFMSNHEFHEFREFHYVAGRQRGVYVVGRQR